MGLVRDVVTCTCLAAVGLYVPAALGATAGPALTALAGVAAGVAGNLGFKAHQAVDRGAAAKITRGWRGIDENHVVVQALRAAYLDAVRAVAKTYRETARATPDWRDNEAFADAVEAFAKTEWTETERLNFVRQRIEHPPDPPAARVRSFDLGCPVGPSRRVADLGIAALRIATLRSGAAVVQLQRRGSCLRRVRHARTSRWSEDWPARGRSGDCIANA